MDLPRMGLHSAFIGAALAVVAILMQGTPVRAQVHGFSRIPIQFSEVQDEILVPNMPAIRDQHQAPLCYTYAAAVLIEHAICREDHLDCKALSSERRPSVLDLSKFAVDVKTIGRGIAPTDAREYPKTIVTTATIDRTLLPLVVLDNLFTSGGMIAKESCAPAEQYFARDPELLQRLAFHWVAHERLRRTNRVSAAEYAASASLEIEALVQNSSASDLIAAFGAKSQGEYFYQVLVPKKCARAANVVQFYTANKQLEYWPRNGEVAQYATSLRTIKGVLTTKVPVVLSVCTLRQATKECANEDGSETRAHAIAVSGFRRACKESQCIDALKVHNSWGETWQREHGDGWVDARDLLGHLSFFPGAIGWMSMRD